ncbi:NXPE family member 3-like [Branchiostoma floridae]|uniref:NXPE family member 3-like n=1 Tax=Branchiostoma floridae TaxID=7739 RepID=A0A9J7MD68_BRAFL|nr:NXPE family member 3-like [Branchiostoma floridae]
MAYQRPDLRDRPVRPPQDYLAIHIDYEDEDRHLAEAAFWPSPPSAGLIRNGAKGNFPVTNPKYTTYRLVNPRDSYTIGDYVNVTIQARDQQNQPKTFGGDYFQVKVYSNSTNSSAAGRVKDHRNGTYTARFRLYWPGEVYFRVVLVHPAEGCFLLKHILETCPLRLTFRSAFQGQGNFTEESECNVWLESGTPHCDYSDPYAGVTWVCDKPRTLSCDRRVNHWVDYEASSVYCPLSDGQKDLINIHFKSSQYLDCLQNKELYFMGDSTGRQWFELLVDTLRLKHMNTDPFITRRAGPHLAINEKRNITVRFRVHGYPLRTGGLNVSHVNFLAREIDTIHGGPGYVLVISVWAHFTSFHLDIYIERMRAIRAAILRLLSRSPGTLVVLKTANTRTGVPRLNSDWYAHVLDRLLRKLFENLKVVILDVWDLTLAHRNRDEIHPVRDVVRQEVQLLLSFVCPDYETQKA